MVLKRACVYGGAGSLGKAVVKSFQDSGWEVTSIGFKSNPKADHNVILERQDSSEDQAEQAFHTLVAQLDDHASDNKEKFQSFVCTAGGWQGGSCKVRSFLKSCHTMMRNSLEPALVVAHLAAQLLAEDGIVSFVSSTAGLYPESKDVGYGTAKCAVNYLSQALAHNGLPKGAKSICFLPTTLKTAKNTIVQMSSDNSSWTPLPVLASQIVHWSTNPSQVQNGSFIVVSSTLAYTSFHEHKSASSATLVTQVPHSKDSSENSITLNLNGSDSSGSGGSNEENSGCSIC